MVDDLFALHETSLIDSWRLLASVDPAGDLTADSDAVTMAHSHPALCNALLRTPKGLERIRKVFPDRHHAVWVRDPDPSLDRALEAAGYRRDERTVPMLLDLRTWTETAAPPTAPQHNPTADPVDAARAASTDAARAVSGDAARAVSGDRARAVSGDRAQAAPDEGAWAVSGDRAQAAPDVGARITPDDVARAASDDGARVTPVDSARVTPDDGARAGAADVVRVAAIDVVRVEPGEVAERSGVGRAMLAEVPHTYGYATAGWEAWAVAMTTGPVANISFVTTRAEFQRRGLGRAVMARALRDARDRGLTHATLQSTPEGLRLYRGLGFLDLGVWQEWVP
ncbi:GNAT family N-acetyltransferase [Actinoplanes sp. CA-054009]